ncbi:MAG: hypothetical protein AVDCRST_MAG71-752 [uncultured Lysobacter sp.]|uniref:Uncharacterized protein n=1 Tax=uncultured Lysobacter sp. TaxID=271060 RepID=A0A6J4KRK7_9GAMM|nr:MAG: hypothetical protein AVDCRST_MAG71-752 [uncultured Lysobacter sp.]
MFIAKKNGSRWMPGTVWKCLDAGNRKAAERQANRCFYVW